MKRILQTVFVIILFGLESCHYDDTPTHFKIINASNISIYYAFSYSYPDTSISKIENIPYYNGNKTAKINFKGNVYVRLIALGSNKTIQLFIFDADVVENNPWDSIKIHNNVLKRYQFSESDLKNWDWIIEYP